jgi:hypothetical protein
MFIPSLFKTVQAGQLNVGGSFTLPIAVTTANAIIIYGGNASNDAGGFPCGNGSGFVYLANSTTVSSFAFIGGGLINFTVIEVYSGFMRSPVQYGSGNLSGGSTGVGVTISAVGPKAFPLFLGLAESTLSAQADMASVTGIVSLFNPTTVLCSRFGGGGANAPDNAFMGFCVVDPK